MRVALDRELGGPEVLVPAERPHPVAGPGEVVIDVSDVDTLTYARPDAGSRARGQNTSGHQARRPARNTPSATAAAPGVSSSIRPRAASRSTDSSPR